MEVLHYTTVDNYDTFDNWVLYEPTITTGASLAEGTNFLNNHIVQIQNIEYIFSGLGSLMMSHCLNAEQLTPDT